MAILTKKDQKELRDLAETGNRDAQIALQDMKGAHRIWKVLADSGDKESERKLLHAQTRDRDRYMSTKTKAAQGDEASIMKHNKIHDLTCHPTPRCGG